MLAHVVTYVREHPLSWLVMAILLLAIIYVIVHYESLFFKE